MPELLLSEKQQIFVDQLTPQRAFVLLAEHLARPLALVREARTQADIKHKAEVRGDGSKPGNPHKTPLVHGRTLEVSPRAGSYKLVLALAERAGSLKNGLIVDNRLVRRPLTGSDQLQWNLAVTLTVPQSQNKKSQPRQFSYSHSEDGILVVPKSAPTTPGQRAQKPGRGKEFELAA